MVAVKAVITKYFYNIKTGFYQKITAPEITSISKVLISIGGWTDSSGDKYSKLVSTGSNRRR